MFWPYHDVLFLNQSGNDQGAFNTLALQNFATALEMDVDAFTACIDDDRYSTLLNADKLLGEEQGVGSTPSLVINGQVYEGVLPFGQFQAIIESELVQNSN